MILKVGEKSFQFFNDVSIQTSLASIASTFTFTVKFDSDNADHKYLCQPLSYHTVRFYDETRLDEKNKGLLSTGIVTDWGFNDEATPDLVQISGYSPGGFLEDCEIPYSLYPLESNNRSLKEIATRLLKPFGIGLVIYDSVTKECNEIIAKSVATPEEKIKDYLSKIAAQKNVIISHDIFGNVIMFRPVVSSTSKIFLQPSNTVKLTLDVNGRGLHSELTSIRQPEKGTGSNPFENDYAEEAEPEPDFDFGPSKSFKISSVDTVKNPLVKVFRPSVDVLSSGTFYTTTTAARNRRAAELQSIRVNFTSNLFLPLSVGDVVEVQDPSCFLYTRTRMIVDSTTISESSDKKYMTGSLVLPETFTGNEPKNIFG
jgi:prophage tail gpP-like protein